MFNNTTVILIVILLLIIYLFDNIKALEEKTLSNQYVKNIFITDYYEPRRKYFKDLHYLERKNHKQPKHPKHPKQVHVSDIVDHDTTLKALYLGIKPEEKINIHSIDKSISGISAPGSTTMEFKLNDKIEQPIYVNKDSEPYYN